MTYPAPPMPSAPEPKRLPSGSSRSFLNVGEAAKALRLDESTLYRHLREGRFPGVKIGGRYLVPTAVIDQLVGEAMSSGQCIDIVSWSTRWRDEQAARALAADHLAGEASSFQTVDGQLRP